MLSFSEKRLILPRTLHQRFISDEVVLLLTGKIAKAYLVGNFFACLNEEFPAFIFKLGAWCAAKTRACLPRFFRSEFSNAPTSHCEMRLAPGFHSFLKWPIVYWNGGLMVELLFIAAFFHVSVVSFSCG